MPNPYEQGGSDRDKGGKPRDLRRFGHFEKRRCDQRHYGRSNTFEDRLYRRKFFVILKEYCYSEDDEKRRKYGSQDRAAYAFPSAYTPADKDGRVNSNESRRSLRKRDHIEEFLLVDPALAIHYFALDKGQHGIASTEGEGADLEICPEKIKEHRLIFVLP